MVKFTTDEKEGWNSYYGSTKEHYFINGISLCRRHKYQTRLYFHKGMKIEDFEESERYQFCKECGRVLKSMLVTKRLDQFVQG